MSVHIIPNDVLALTTKAEQNTKQFVQTAVFGDVATGFQFHDPYFDAHSLTVTPIDMLFQNECFAHGTAFIWTREDAQYLITNWHNVSGQNPFDSSFRNRGARVPDAIRLYPATITDSGINKHGAREEITLPLFDSYHQPLWKQHRYFNKLRIDIVAIPLPNNGRKYSALNDFFFDKLFTHVGTDVFIVGYPFDRYDDLKLPIWKRGSIASELLAAWDNKPMFLIDSASRPGMSGSPVFRRIFGPAALCTPTGLTTKLDSVMTTEFIGVYAGHLTTANADLTIGFAWYASLIDEILEYPAAGTRL